ncbi:DUF3035 domain-containing protein [Thioclava sp. GXIMD4216]|uniref:DUF3035 domain-containing protein n=1 Tax=Thioclava litoralis TaxID=3076557 RepID=A0ABZ1E1K9_9RHOB|nr:DUF3035 domain-containing protein [Thioclava sp. FTW29]
MSAASNLGIALAGVLLLGACGGSNVPELMKLRTNRPGPDEFAIVPTKSLQMPSDLNDLPTPTPGGRNLVDPTPEADAIAALGGSSNARTTAGADRALIGYAMRKGTDPAIRSQLAAADLEYRKDHNGRLLDRLTGKTLYYQAYAPMALDQEAELERWRKLNAATPSAPPSGAAQAAK